MEYFFFQAWNKSNNETKKDFEYNLNCCGFNDPTENVPCEAECVKDGDTSGCEPCKTRITSKIDYAFNSSGGVGLFFAFTEVRNF